MLITESNLRKILKAMILKEFKKATVGKSNYATKMKRGSTDFETGETTVASGVKWGPEPNGSKRKSAWELLREYLPDGTQLTSCYRSQEDQDRIIKNYAKEKGYSEDIADPENPTEEELDAMHAFIKEKGLVVSRNVGAGHGGVGDTGAFDLSGANLDDIWEGVTNANEYLTGRIKFADLNNGSIIERKNNAVHVHFEISDIDTDQIKSDEEETEKAAGLDTDIENRIDRSLDFYRESETEDGIVRWYVYDDLFDDDKGEDYYFAAFTDDQKTNVKVYIRDQESASGFSEIYEDENIELFDYILRDLIEYEG